MITCDYLIIGSGFAGIALKYKLLGKTIMIDKDPFSYKIGESHIPDLIHADPGIFSLVPKLMKMKSYTRKLGTIFCDSYHGKYATNFPTPLGTRFALHCERQEIEQLLVKELGVEIRQETILDIDLEKNIVKTDRETYRFTKYLLDCSGPAMVIAKKLDLVSPVGQFEGMKAQWSYWAIDRLNDAHDSWAHWTVLNKIGADSWVWQIPIYNSTILSMGMLHRGEPFPKDKFIDHIEKYSAACYKLTSIARNPARAVKPYMKEIHSRFHYSRRSRQCSGRNWILVGDAFCFADPVYSVGSGVAMMEAVTIADNLNKNHGRFDHAWYEKHCNGLIKAVITGISTWYSGTAFDKKVNEEVNRTILRGGFSRHFRPSRITENAKQLQEDTIEVFLPSVGEYALIFAIKVYYFDKRSFVREKKSLSMVNRGKSLRITNKAVEKVMVKHVIGKRLSFHDLYLIAVLNLSKAADQAYFWKVIRFVELTCPKTVDEDRLYYFHPERYETLPGGLKLGDRQDHLIIRDPASIEFFEKLKGKILLGKEIDGLGDKTFSPKVRRNVETFIKTFKGRVSFGQNFCLQGS